MKLAKGTLVWHREYKEFGIIIGIKQGSIYCRYEMFWATSGYLALREKDLEDPRYIIYE